MIPPLGFNFKQAVEIQRLSKKGSEQALFGLKTEVLYCFGHKKYNYIKIQPPVITYGCELGLLNEDDLCLQSHHKSEQLREMKNVLM